MVNFCFSPTNPVYAIPVDQAFREAYSETPSSFLEQSTWLGYSVCCLASAGLGYTMGYLAQTILNPETSQVKKKIALCAESILVLFAHLLHSSTEEVSNRYPFFSKESFAYSLPFVLGGQAFSVALTIHKPKERAVVLLPTTTTTPKGEEVNATHHVTVVTSPSDVVEANRDSFTKYQQAVDRAGEQLEQDIQQSNI